MEPHDEPSTEPSFADNEPETAAPQIIEEHVPVEPDIGAALLLSGNYSRSLADRVFSALTPEEIIRLSQALVRLKALPEDRVERIWNRLTLLFTGDWREEDDLVEFIRSVLRQGVRDEPVMAPVQKLAMLLLNLPEDCGTRITSTIMGTLNRQGIAELTREMAHLLHYPAAGVHDRVAGEFLAFCAARALPNTAFMNVHWMEIEAERLVRRDVASCADVVQRLWLAEGAPVQALHEAARQQPEKTVAQLCDFAYGPAHYYYIPPLERLAAFRVCLSSDAVHMLDDALQVEEGALPEPFVSPVRKEIVLRDFLHRYYLEYMKIIPLVMQ